MITDTLAYKEKLEAGGFTSEQAKALVEANRDHTVDLVTKEDLRRDIKDVLNRFDQLQQRLDTREQRMETTIYKAAFASVIILSTVVTLMTKVF